MLVVNILLILSALLNFLLSFFLFSRIQKNNYSRLVLGFISLCVAFWCLTIFMYRISLDIQQITFWGKIAHVFGAILAPLFFLFSMIFVKKRITKWIRNTFAVLGFLFIIFSIFILKTNSIIGDGYIENDIRNISLFNGYYLYIVFVFVHFLLGFIVLIKRYYNISGVEKEQIKYILIGTLLAASGASIFDLIYPIFYDFSLNWFGPVITIVMVISMTYAIVRYRLMNIRFILTRSILYGILIASVTAFFALSVLVVGERIGGNTQVSKIFTYVFTSFIVVVFLDPVKRFFAKVTDKMFYKDKIDYQRLLQQAGNVVVREIDLEKLSHSLSNLLSTELKIKEVSTLIAKDKSFVLLSTSQKTKQNFKLSVDFINFIQERKDFIIIEELIRAQSDIGSESPYYQVLDNFIKEAEGFNVEMVVPIADDNNVITAIFLFSAKSSGDLYNQDDINFLKVLVPQIGTAIEKSKLYEEVQVFNRELQAKVEDRTKSLREANLGLEERNKFLTTMQIVINMVSRTLDLKQVNQMIANSIALELGYVGGVLSFVDETSHTLKIGAITDNDKTKDVISILGKDPKSFEAQLKPEFSLGAQTVLSGKINFSEKMSDFFSPPVDPATIDKLQAYLGVKTVVGLPIFSENKIIGIIHFLLSVERHHISALDIETMTALTNQVGIVSRNLRLYNNLQSANLELQEANLRLRELDRAKSEFLSIASHQLRTPISALKGYLSMMIDGDFGPVPDKIQVVIKDLFESASRLARLINVFLNVSRIESGRLKLEKHPVQINDLITSVIKELDNQALQKKLTLSYQAPAQALPLVNADSDKLREVILNLIDNSIKYTLTGSVNVSASADNKDFHFVVKDTGIGIDPEEAKTLFRKFVRGSGVAQIHTGGSGLGLFIAQKIIKEHGGQVWAESEGKGKGSTFQFVIPIDGNGEMTKIAKAEEFK